MTASTLKENLKELTSFYHGFDDRGTNQLLVTISTGAGLCVCVVKLILGIVLSSSIWLFSGIYSFFLAGTRFLFLRNLYLQGNRRQTKTTAVRIALCLMIAGVIFNLCAMFRQFDKNIGQQFPTIIVVLVSIMIVLSYVLSIIGIFRARKIRDLSFYTYRVISVSGALMNFVLLQRMILSKTSLTVDWILAINSIFSYFIGGTLVVAAAVLLIKAVKENV